MSSRPCKDLALLRPRQDGRIDAPTTFAAALFQHGRAAAPTICIGFQKARMEIRAASHLEPEKRVRVELVTFGGRHPL